jgi:cardiolipin synthase
MMNRKVKWNVPNLLSLLRLLSFPLILYLVFSHQERMFIILIIIALVTDILDGFIARTFNLESEFGAKLDSYADNLMYVGAITGLIVFKAEDFAPYLVSFTIFILLFILPKIVAYYKFREFPSLHLYSSKAATLLQGLFFLYLFLIGFHSLFYYIVIIWCILSYLEQIAVLILIPESRSDLKGLYWILKNKHQAGDQ